VSVVHEFFQCPICLAVAETIDDQQIRLPAACRTPDACADGLEVLPPLGDDVLKLSPDDTTPIHRREPILPKCQAIGCERDVPLGRSWCSGHWSMMPSHLKSRINHARTDRERAELREQAKAVLETLEFGKRLL
jgi:hypothetical protein